LALTLGYWQSVLRRMCEILIVVFRFVSRLLKRFFTPTILRILQGAMSQIKIPQHENHDICVL